MKKKTKITKQDENKKTNKDELKNNNINYNKHDRPRIQQTKEHRNKPTNKETKKQRNTQTNKQCALAWIRRQMTRVRFQLVCCSLLDFFLNPNNLYRFPIF